MLANGRDVPGAEGKEGAVLRSSMVFVFMEFCRRGAVLSSLLCQTCCAYALGFPFSRKTMLLNV